MFHCFNYWIINECHSDNSCFDSDLQMVGKKESSDCKNTDGNTTDLYYRESRQSHSAAVKNMKLEKYLIQ
jgi:hypothetical protein